MKHKDAPSDAFHPFLQMLESQNGIFNLSMSGQGGAQEFALVQLYLHWVGCCLFI